MYFMFCICMTLCSTHVGKSNLFDKKTMVSVEMIYKLLDGIRQAQSDSRKTRIICRLYAMLYTSDTGNKLIKQTTQRIYELVSPPHWYQLIIWNNFFHGLFSLRDKKFENVRNYITFKSIKHKQQQTSTLICVDYLIERQFNYIKWTSSIGRIKYTITNKLFT